MLVLIIVIANVCKETSPLTYAKYRISVDGVDSARVAKWEISKNEDVINMKYRLRIANASFDNVPWQDISEINVNGLTVEANSKALCALDWTWLESYKDTEIGENGCASYSLSIHFSVFEKIK